MRGAARVALAAAVLAATAPACGNKKSAPAGTLPLPAASALPPFGPEEIAEPIYEGGLKGGWQDGGWCPRSTTGPGPAELHLAQRGAWMVLKPGLDWRSAGGLAFRFKPPPGEGGFLEVRVESPGLTTFPRVRLEARHMRAAPDGWFDVRVPISELDPAVAEFDRVVLRAFRDIADAPTLVDDLALTKGAPQTTDHLEARQFVPARGVKLGVSCSARASRISPLIYGLAFDPDNDATTSQWTGGATARRWGGHRASRYNWKLSTWNRGAEGYFENEKSSRTWEEFLDEDRAHDVASALTIPMLGWVAKDDTSVSFPVSAFGPQGKTDPQHPDAGDGTRPAGPPLVPGPPTRTSVAAPPAFVKQWIETIRAGDADAGARRVQEYILDDEPMTWTGAERDVRTDPVGYDELLRRTIDYATAIRQADPDAVIAGPAEWGWTGYFYSDKDVAAGTLRRPDRRAHEDLPLIDWYLKQVRAYQQKTGVRLLDVLDLHFFPAAANVYAHGAAGDAKTAALRLRSTRALWDPSYVDESWIAAPVKLIPRMKAWIDADDPGLGLSIGEWSFGGEDDPSGALAIAEALGRFAQLGVTSAYYWTHPADGSPAWLGFLAFRNFDARGGKFLDWYVPTTDAPGTSLFASRDEAGQHLVAVAVNMSPSEAVLASIDLGACGPAASVEAYSYLSGRQDFAPWAEPAHGDASLEQILPPESITVLDVHLAHPMTGELAR